MNPEILVLDEPTAGLDPAGSTEMYQFLLKLRKEKILQLLWFHIQWSMLRIIVTEWRL